MVTSRWLYLTVAVVAIACDQNVPSGPSLTHGPPRYATPFVTATSQTGTITISGSDGYPGEQISLTPYPYDVIADITLSGAAHFEGDTLYTPGHLPSGDIGPAGILVGANCHLLAAVAFRIGFLAPSAPCTGTPSGPQSFDTTELISGTPAFGVGSAASTRNFCGPTTICVTWSGTEQVVIKPRSAMLTLSVDQPVADSGTLVTATAAVDPPTIVGIMVPVLNIDWQLPDPAAGCASNSRTCTFTATRSGEIQVAAIVNGTTQTSAASLSVRPKPDSMPHDSTGSDSTGPCLAPRLGAVGRSVPGLKTSGPALMRSGCGGGGPSAALKCLPQTVTRGDIVSCVVTASSGGVVYSWDVTGADGNQMTDISNSNSLVGRAALSSSVKANVSFPGGVKLPAQDAFAVVARTWPDAVAKQQPFESNWSPAPGLPDGTELVYPPTQVTNQLGITAPWSYDFNAGIVAPDFETTQGPNNGWMITTKSMPSIEPSVYVNKALVSTDPFYALQNGRRIPGAHSPKPFENFYCSQGQMDAYLIETRQHEGSLPGLPSHYQVYVEQTPLLALSQSLESVVQFEGPTSNNDSIKAFYDSINTRFRRWDAKMDAAQTALHSMTGGKISTVCIFRQEGNP